jgi:peptidoglycan/xylan/chitin deacetylase (PgdA/CDA1 family)
VDLLLANGFAYDSSLMGHDNALYRVRRDDRWGPDEPYAFGKPCDLVEVPVYWGLDDFPVFELVPGRWGGGAAPSAVYEVWRGDLDYAYDRCPGGVVTLTMHPQSIGRGHRMLMLERLLAHLRDRGDVAFERVDRVAAAWAAANPLLGR